MVVAPAVKQLVNPEQGGGAGAMPWQGSPAPLWLPILAPETPAQPRTLTKFLPGAYGNPRKGKGMGTGEGAEQRRGPWTALGSRVVE